MSLPNFKWKKFSFGVMKANDEATDSGMSITSAVLNVQWATAPGDIPRCTMQLDVSSGSSGRHTHELDPIYITLFAQNSFNSIRVLLGGYNILEPKNGPNPQTLSAQLPEIVYNAGVPLEYFTALSGAIFVMAGLQDTN